MRIAVRRRADVVNIEDVDRLHAETLLAILVRAHDAVERIVETRPEGQGLRPVVIAWLHRVVGPHEPPDLGAQYVAFALAHLQRLSDAPLRKRIAVERRSVEVADTGVPRPLEERIGLGGRHGLVEAAQLRATEAECG